SLTGLVSLGKFAPTGSIIVYGQAGNDNIAVDPMISLPSIQFGGDGNDTMQGGNGPGILVGGNGADNLSSGNGRDILIGGAGQESTMVGGNGDDILIAGATGYDTNATALSAIAKEWLRSDITYQARISHLTGATSGGLNG